MNIAVNALRLNFTDALYKIFVTYRSAMNVVITCSCTSYFLLTCNAQGYLL